MKKYPLALYRAHEDRKNGYDVRRAEDGDQEKKLKSEGWVETPAEALAEAEADAASKSSTTSTSTSTRTTKSK